MRAKQSQSANPRSAHRLGDPAASRKGCAAIAFVHPYRFCERGTWENTIGLLRQYFPKKMPLDRVDLTRVGEVERALNGRPRKILEFRTPAELLSELVTNTGITDP